MRDILSRIGARKRLTGRRAYVFGLVAVSVAFIVTGVLIPLADDVLFAPLVGTVVIISVYYGVGPALVATAVGWVAVLFVYVEPRWRLTPETSEAISWGVGLAVALVLIWASWTLQRLRDQATPSRDRGGGDERRLSRAARDRRGARLGGDAVRGRGSAARARPSPARRGRGLAGPRRGRRPRDRRPRRPDTCARARPPASADDKAPITVAARTGTPAHAGSRDEFAREFPDGARLAPYAQSALAVPLRIGGRVAGSIGFPFTRANAIDENVLSLARIAGELGGQALERSLAYERERAARDGLERITRLAPRFADAPEGELAAAICTEARELFEADVAQLWKVSDRRLEVIWRDPPDELAPPGHVVEPRDYPGMQRSLERLDTTFFPDAREVVVGEALERVMAEGVRSVLRVPIVVAGRAEVLLALRWARVIPEPSPELLALARRFADHAGLVIEQGERRRAEEIGQVARARAERLAGDLAQLHSLATALGGGVDGLGGRLARRRAGARDDRCRRGRRLRRRRGRQATRAAHVGRVGRGARARGRRCGYRRGHRGRRRGRAARSHLARGRDRLVGRDPLPCRGDSRRRCCGSGSGPVIGRTTPPAGSSRRSPGQAAPPLERARLHESEHEARLQAELSARRTRRLQALTAAFSGALTPAEVAATFLDETVEAVGAAAAALAVTGRRGAGAPCRPLPGVPRRAARARTVSSPWARAGLRRRAVRVQEAAYYDDVERSSPTTPSCGARSRSSGLRSFAFVPVTAGAAPLGVAVLAWTQPGRLVDDERSLPRGGRRAMRPRPRPRSSLRGRAGGRRDAPAERPPRDVPVDGGRDASRRCTSRARRPSTSVATGSTR